ncbi:hypothetical protein [Candidatus Nitronereus thalassa]|uniref:Uncharacterized protein n=1 Tax=Candidatus Nitronereus thalassa TaxID=3020898 RepID=A0ABU3KCD6_9BACT|nr:hypothetical protein [Candidatus Nitronereus thalassa]MDT7043963.1 hypothetical protein [Candidatus Nitronereus thalassa]
MKPDIEKYMPYLDEYDLTEDKKVQLIKDVWLIMESFVDQAWGLHPVQQCTDRHLIQAGKLNLL